MRLYLDEDSMDRRLLATLRDRGHDCLTAEEASMRGRTDADQLAFAATAVRVLYTFNVGDFCRLHSAWMRAGRAHAGMVVVSDKDMSIGRQAAAIDALADQEYGPGFADRLFFLTNYVTG